MRGWWGTTIQDVLAVLRPNPPHVCNYFPHITCMYVLLFGTIAAIWWVSCIIKDVRYLGVSRLSCLLSELYSLIHTTIDIVGSFSEH